MINTETSIAIDNINTAGRRLLKACELIDDIRRIADGQLSDSTTGGWQDDLVQAIRNRCGGEGWLSFREGVVIQEFCRSIVRRLEEGLKSPHLNCPSCPSGTVGEHAAGCRALNEF